jgi:pilus assembly protein CpaD
MRNQNPRGIAGGANSSAARCLRMLGALVLGSSLGACGAMHPLPPPATPYDYKDRHPIVMSETSFFLDIFPEVTHGRLDSETTSRLVAFSKRHLEFDDGPIVMSTPNGGSSGRSIVRESEVVARALASLGVKDVTTTAYPVVDPSLAAPIRLSFKGLKARVADRCGLWPRDLASGTSLDGWLNETYWNFGCASQNMIATQTADPRDLVSPRGSTPADIEMRMRGIGKVRQGTDPATGWSTKAGQISGVGG